ncbi:MAG: hypothetical protein EOM19_01710 [Candidatus Moranbacteria bacterium]|nr:hypothetical protein [Candidatus Moranbacteria bacterium]
MAKITFEKGDYVTFFGRHTGYPVGRVIGVTTEGPLVVFAENERVIKNMVFTDTSHLVPAYGPTQENNRYALIFQAISAIFPELDNPPEEADPAEQSDDSSSDHGVDAGDFDGPA